MNRMARLVLGGWGRRAAWTMLAVLLLLQVFVPSLFNAARFGLFDSYQRLAGRDRYTNAVVIVAIDNPSLQRIGQWPWPRQLIARLVSNIAKAGAATVGIDLLLSEPDRQSPDSDRALADTLRKDQQDTERGNRITLEIGTPALENPFEGATDSGPLVPFREIGLSPGRASPAVVPSFQKTMRAIPALDAAATGHGFASVIPDADGTFRRMPLVSRISGRLAPGLALEMLRLAVRNPPARHVDVFYSNDQIQKVSIGALDIPTQEDGSLWVNFSPHDEGRFVSAYKVLSGEIKPGTFDGAVVLVGETGIGRIDQQMTPAGQMPGVEIHAELLENILQGNSASRPSWTRAAEFALTFLLALLLILLLPLLKPRWQVLFGGAVFAALAGLGFGLWHHSYILLDVATPAIGQALVVIAYMSAGFAQADMQRRRLRQELELRKLAAARTEGELEAARRIQMGILPDPKALGRDPRFELDALMIPARQIGGDLFDFFKLEDGRLFFSVGDVSGKGVPAALFMALGKSLCKSIALSGGAGIGAILDRANSEISRENPEMLFITLYAGILDLDTGTLDFCSAGHDAPFLLRAGEKPQAVDSEGGPPLCVVEDFSYPAERFALKPGDLLCIITDGITEAMTADNMVMGRPRVSDVLAALPPDLPASAVIKALHDAVELYVAGAEPSDDLTILAVRWHGPTAR